MYLRDKLGVIDIEASGLGSHSYPIEIGLMLANGQQYQALIQPLSDWTHWDAEAEKIHGITRAQILAEGKSVQEVCLEINNLCDGQTLYSDCWVYDNVWLNSLYTRAGVVPSFACSPIEALLNERQTQRYLMCKSAVQQHLGLRQHRALNDAKIIQKALSVLMTPNHADSLPQPDILVGDLADMNVSHKSSEAHSRVPSKLAHSGYAAN